MPLTVRFGEQAYLDGVDMTLDGFLHRLRASAVMPTSSQPARRTFAIRTGACSSTVTASSRSISRPPNRARGSRRPRPRVSSASRQVRVIDSRSNSVGAGLVIEAVGEALEQGASLDELERFALSVRNDVTVFGAIQDLEFAVRGGRVSARAARVIDGLHLKPVIVFDRLGHAGKGGAAVGFGRALDSVARRAERFADGAPVRLMITHTDAPEWVEYLRARLRERFGVQHVPAVRSGAVLDRARGPGVSVGRGPPAAGRPEAARAVDRRRLGRRLNLGGRLN